MFELKDQSGSGNLGMTHLGCLGEAVGRPGVGETFFVLSVEKDEGARKLYFYFAAPDIEECIPSSKTPFSHTIRRTPESSGRSSDRSPGPKVEGGEGVLRFSPEYTFEETFLFSKTQLSKFLGILGGTCTYILTASSLLFEPVLGSF